MSRRTSLPGAAELFRRTGEDVEAEAGPTPVPGRAQQLLAEGDLRARDAAAAAPDGASVGRPTTPTARAGQQRRRVSPDAERRPTGRERHDEKITVYVSSEELMDLERARLSLRGDHGLAVDRGRIVREALGLVLADLEARGDDSTLVRRLQGD